MATVTFDTHKFIQRLKSAGLPEAQAEAVADAFKEAHGESDLVTKKDLQLELAPIRSDLTPLKWMTGLVVAGILSLILKAFF